MTRAVLPLAGLLIAIGCGGAGTGATGPDAAAVARARAGDRLQGRWVLVDFRPEQPLEPMFASLLAAQMGAMTLDITGQQLKATGLGIQADRSFQVTSTNEEQVTLAIYDHNRLDYEISGTFVGPEFQFVALTSPWRGQGRLRRVE